MEQKATSVKKENVPFLQTMTGQVVMLAATSVFSGFCMAVGGVYTTRSLQLSR